VRIESTPAHSERMSKPKVEHVENKTRRGFSIRKAWNGTEQSVEIKFESEAEREVTIILSKDDTAALVLFVAEKIIPGLVAYRNSAP